MTQSRFPKLLVFVDSVQATTLQKSSIGELTYMPVKRKCGLLSLKIDPRYSALGGVDFSNLISSRIRIRIQNGCESGDPEVLEKRG
jgi:hypothetical protein